MGVVQLSNTYNLPSTGGIVFIGKVTRLRNIVAYFLIRAKGLWSQTQKALSQKALVFRRSKLIVFMTKP